MKKAGLPGLVGLVALLLIVAGCSEDAPTAASATTEGKKIVASMSAVLANPAQAVSQEDATCIAARLVDEVGVSKLRDEDVVDADYAYSDGAVENSAVGTEFTAARSFCLEEKVAVSMATSIASDSGLLDSEHATCVAQDFSHQVGLDQLITDQVVDANLDYVENSALHDAGNARTFSTSVTDCLGPEPALAKLRSVVEDGYASKSGAVAGTYAECFLPTFVEQTGVEGLFVNQFVSDKGEYVYQGKVYDTETATALAAAILGCVDTLKADSAAAAAADKSLDADQLEACAKRAITPEFLRDEFLVKQLLGKVKEARAAATATSQKFERCVAAQK